MDKKFRYIDNLILRYPKLSNCREDITYTYLMLEECFSNGGKLLIAGNGGSATDALHIVGELMKSFLLPRRLDEKYCDLIDIHSTNAGYLKQNLQMALPAMALVSEIGLTTAYSNDVASDLVFAQQVLGYGEERDVFLGITTSGNSKNIVYAVEMAKAKGMKTICLTGKTGGVIKDIVDVCINVPEFETYVVQELHLPIYHTLCMQLEEHFFSERI